MKTGFKLLLAAGLAVTISQPLARAAEEKAPASAFKDEKEKASYAVGLFFGNQIKNGNLDVDMSQVSSGMKDVLDGREPKLSQAEAGATIRSYQQAQQAKLAEKNKKEGDAFLAANKSKPGIKTHAVEMPDGKAAEMQYKILTDGTGPTPHSNDTVSVTYRGTLINGKEFDSSAKHGNQPAKFNVRGVVRGWTEALQMMHVGSKWEVFIPASLAYGDMGRPGIEPGSTLIFEMELLATEPPPQAAPAQPLTSDIIKVPSAEELKKGAKIEVIKAEDAAKMAQTNSAK